MEDGTLIHSVLSHGRWQQGVLIREDGTVLSDDIKEVDPAGLNGFCDMEIRIIIRDGSQDGAKPSIPGLKKLHPQLSLSEDIHAPEIANDTQAGWELDVGPQLLDQLAQHQLHGLAHFIHNALTTDTGLHWEKYSEIHPTNLDTRGQHSYGFPSI